MVSRNQGRSSFVREDRPGSWYRVPVFTGKEEYCPTCGKKFEVLPCLTCGGTGTQGILFWKRECGGCKGKKTKLRCPDRCVSLHYPLSTLHQVPGLYSLDPMRYGPRYCTRCGSKLMVRKCSSCSGAKGHWEAAPQVPQPTQSCMSPEEWLARTGGVSTTAGTSSQIPGRVWQNCEMCHGSGGFRYCPSCSKPYLEGRYKGFLK